MLDKLFPNKKIDVFVSSKVVKFLLKDIIVKKIQYIRLAYS